MFEISVVIPAYNEELRIPSSLRELKAFSANGNDLFNIKEVLVVDDGSVDGTSTVVKELQTEWSLLKIHSFSANRGKGAAVHAGLKEAVCEWVLIADADMATPWIELHKLLGASSADLLMGSRALPESVITRRQHWVRENLGKTFNRILRWFIGLPFRDTQCGFKLLRNDFVFRTTILPHLKVSRFAWDVELILLLMKHHREVKEIPVSWQHQDHSRVRLLNDSFEMLFAVLQLRRRLK